MTLAVNVIVEEEALTLPTYLPSTIRGDRNYLSDILYMASTNDSK